MTAEVTAAVKAAVKAKVAMRSKAAGSARGVRKADKPRAGRPSPSAGRGFGAGPGHAPVRVPTALGAGARSAIETAVTALGFELVDVERAPRGLLRVTIDRLPGGAYASGPGDFVTVDDCELVTRQLQYALEVDGVAYERLEVSSPGLDRVLNTAAHFERFCGAAVALELRQPLQGRKVFKGVLGRAEAEGWTLVFDDGRGEQVLGFALDEVREARLVPVLDFKGRGRNKAQEATMDAAPLDGGQDR